jgi:hypothetical protein
MARRDPKYGAAHDKLRARVALAVKRGGVHCARCRLPIHPTEPWDLDHIEGTVNGYRGASHARCNRATSTHRAQRGQHPSLTAPSLIERGAWSRHWFGAGYDERCQWCVELGRACDIVPPRERADYLA